MMCNGDASTEQLSSCMARVNICDDDDSNIFHQILGSDVGMQIYRYLHPKDLCSVGSCNRQLRDGIIRRNKLAAICLQHLPLQLGAGTNYSVKLREGASFASKEILFEHVMEKLETKAGWNTPMPDEDWTSGHLAMCESFVKAVANDQPPETTGDLGLDVVRVVYSAYCSAAEGRRVEI